MKRTEVEVPRNVLITHRQLGRFLRMRGCIFRGCRYPVRSGRRSLDAHPWVSGGLCDHM